MHITCERERKVLSDNEWAGWLQWIRNAFRFGTLMKDWKHLEMESWFDPGFKEFIDKDIIPSVQTS